MIDWFNYAAGNHRVTCPACGRGDRDRTLGLTIEAAGNGVSHCFRCEYTESHRPDRGTWIGSSVKPLITVTASIKHARLRTNCPKLGWRSL
ncbi:ribosomal protein S27AE [Paraburkholderia bannensis]|uniref:Ribosomal protein S27AE n=1 Tax=Paraburkholderia bannensis TaxID=765414 RepID=A0A7W9WWA0_9BURK|nr:MULTISPECIES: hypothetical protein [Paraburkholderia]MBB3261190.1 ribosomal protein S27AE [Paraburkholderia sp. WP4_3_2]MBB6106227.1 ribosomal protein S27AE [Paraburkholderia bannensis]